MLQNMNTYDHPNKAKNDNRETVLTIIDMSKSKESFQDYEQYPRSLSNKRPLPKMSNGLPSTQRQENYFTNVPGPYTTKGTSGKVSLLPSITNNNSRDNSLKKVRLII